MSPATAYYSLLPSSFPVILLAILAGSCAMFILLSRRWTTQQRWQALQDWADQNRFVLHGEKQAVAPEVLRKLCVPPPRVLLSLSDVDTAAVQVETPAHGASSPQRWNLLVRKISTEWPTTGLRPANAAQSVLDFFPLQDMQAKAPSERFFLYGVDARAARALAKSSAQALLPHDVAMLLTGNSLVLDFSTRPFDQLEVERLDTLAEQLVTHLPTPS